MARRLLTGAFAAAALTVVAQGAPKIWEKPVNTWTDAEVRTILTSSPWAGQGRITHTHFAMMGQEAPRIWKTAVMSWTSALPVRQALSLHYNKNGWEVFLRSLESRLTRAFPVYTVTVKLSYERYDPESDQKNVLMMQAETFLFRDGKPPIKAIQVDVWNDYRVPRDFPNALFLYVFSASDPITLADKEVTFFTRICGFFSIPADAPTECSYDIEKTFKLKDMVISGELVL